MVKRIHSIPLNDLDIHSAQETCWCHPFNNGENILLHNSKDCRERYERLGDNIGDGWVNIEESVDEDILNLDSEELEGIRNILIGTKRTMRQALRVLNFNINGFDPNSLDEGPVVEFKAPTVSKKEISKGYETYRKLEDLIRKLYNKLENRS